jgi:hypothetical protein
MCWVEKLQQRLGSDVEICNLARVCASNLYISLQVRQALEHQADYVIYLATSNVRLDIPRTANTTGTLFDRYRTNDLMSYSINSLDHTTRLDSQTLDLLRDHRSKCFDLDLEIYKNQCIIEHTLHTLTTSKIPYVFDRGGFDHKSFSETQCEYFSNYQKYFSEINLWDHATSRSYRPYFHVTDDHTTNQIADYFATLISKSVS